jgi:hypothetical protein
MVGTAVPDDVPTGNPSMAAAGAIPTAFLVIGGET